MTRFAWCALLFLAACGPSVHSQLRADYDDIDRQHVARVAVVATPLPNDDALQGKLWSLLARRYINQHRDFIVKNHSAAPTLQRDAACTGQDGVLVLQVSARPKGGDVAIELRAQLLRCRDGEEVWSGSVRGSWPSAEPNVGELRAHYAAEVGEAIEPFVAPAFYALRALLETLPQPVLDDAAQMEKIELGE